MLIPKGYWRLNPISHSLMDSPAGSIKLNGREQMDARIGLFRMLHYSILVPSPSITCSGATGILMQYVEHAEQANLSPSSSRCKSRVQCCSSMAASTLECQLAILSHRSSYIIWPWWWWLSFYPKIWPPLDSSRLSKSWEVLTVRNKYWSQRA